MPNSTTFSFSHVRAIILPLEIYQVSNSQLLSFVTAIVVVVLSPAQIAWLFWSQLIHQLPLEIPSTPFAQIGILGNKAFVACIFDFKFNEM